MNLEIIIQAIISGLSIGFVYALVSLGLTLIWGTMEIINFAHGDFLMLSMYGSFWFFTLFGIDPLISLPLVFLISFIFGVLVYKGVIKTILNRQMLSQVLATYGLGMVFQALALFFWSPNYRLIRGNFLKGTFRLGNISIGIPQFVTSVICIVAILALFYFLDKTKIGRAIKATTLNKDAAALVGINIEFIFTLVLGLGIALVGMAGSLLSNFYYIYPQVGALFGTLAYVVVAIGGFGSVQGALMGGLLLGLITSLTGVLINPAFKYAAAFLVYLIVVLIKPTGLKGW